MKEPITVQTSVSAPVDLAWKIFTDPERIVSWNTASDDWHTTKARNDLRAGGTFAYRMEAKDGSDGFDLSGVYDEVIPGTKISYTLDDGRKVEVLLEAVDTGTLVTETFEPESENTRELQQSGWQAILDNFKRYAEEQ